MVRLHDRSPADKWRTALHEAGHAYAAVKCGLKVYLATVVPDEEQGLNGCVQFREDASNPYRTVVVAFAGPVAVGEEPRADDWHLATRALRLMRCSFSSQACENAEWTRPTSSAETGP